MADAAVIAAQEEVLDRVKLKLELANIAKQKNAAAKEQQGQASQSQPSTSEKTTRKKSKKKSTGWAAQSANQSAKQAQQAQQAQQAKASTPPAQAAVKPKQKTKTKTQPKKYTLSKTAKAQEKRRITLERWNEIDESHPSDIFDFVNEQPMNPNGQPDPKTPTPKDQQTYRRALAEARVFERSKISHRKFVWIEFDFSDHRRFHYQVVTGNAPPSAVPESPLAISECCCPFAIDKDLRTVHSRLYVNAKAQSPWQEGTRKRCTHNIAAPSQTDNLVIMVWFGTLMYTDLRHDACAVFPVLRATHLTEVRVRAFNPMAVIADYNPSEDSRDDELKSVKDNDKELYTQAWYTLNLNNWIEDVPSRANAVAAIRFIELGDKSEVVFDLKHSDMVRVVRRPENGVYMPFAEACNYAMVTEALASLSDATKVSLHMETSIVQLPGMSRYLMPVNGTRLTDESADYTTRAALVAMVFQKLHTLSRAGVMYSTVDSECFVHSRAHWMMCRLDRLRMIQVNVGNKIPPVLLAQRSMMSAINLAAMVMGCDAMEKSDINNIDLDALEEQLAGIKYGEKFEKVEMIMALLKIAARVRDGEPDMWLYAYNTMAMVPQRRDVQCGTEDEPNPLGLGMKANATGMFEVPLIFFDE